MNAALCPFCKRGYENSDLRRIYNDDEVRTPLQELQDLADKLSDVSVRKGSKLHFCHGLRSFF